MSYRKKKNGIDGMLHKKLVAFFFLSCIFITFPIHACSIEHSENENLIFDPDFSVSYDVRYAPTDYASKADKEALIPVCYLEKKCGYMDSKAMNIKPPIFEYADYFYQGVAIVRLNSKFGMIDTKGNMIVKPQFDSISEFNEGVAIIKKNGKFGYISNKGDIVVKPKFDIAEGFSEGMAVVGVRYSSSSEGVKFGYVNNHGNIVIGTKFDFASSFSKGMATVGVNNNKIEYYRCGACGSGSCSRYVKKYSLINNKGETVSSVNARAMNISLQKNNQSAAIDSAGQKIQSKTIHSGYQFIGNFYNGLARACKNDKKGTYYYGEFWELRVFSSGVDDTKICKWGFVNRNGDWMENYEYDKARFIKLTKKNNNDL